MCTKNNGTSTVVYQIIGTYWAILEIYRNLYHFFGTWFGTPTFLVHRHNFWSPEKTKKHEPAKHSKHKVHIRNAYYSRKYRINTILDRCFRPIFWRWNRATALQVTDLRQSFWKKNFIDLGGSNPQKLHILGRRWKMRQKSAAFSLTGSDWLSNLASAENRGGESRIRWSSIFSVPTGNFRIIRTPIL